eukprot:scaffold68775_cov32-Phaeocystis_antarctica.AAC.3
MKVGSGLTLWLESSIMVGRGSLWLPSFIVTVTGPISVWSMLARTASPWSAESSHTGSPLITPPDEPLVTLLSYLVLPGKIAPLTRNPTRPAKTNEDQARPGMVDGRQGRRRGPGGSGWR